MGGGKLMAMPALSPDPDDPLLAAYEKILADARKHRAALMTDRLMAAFIRDRIAVDFETFPLMEGLGR